MKDAPNGALDLKGFTYDPDTGLAKFSLYLPKKKGIERARKQLHVASVEEALQAYLDFRAAALAGKPGQPVMTFAQFINTYFDRIAAKVAPKTATEYRRVIENHLLPAFGGLRLDEITNAEVDTFEAKLIEKGRTLATRNDYLAVLRLLLRHAADTYSVIDVFPLKPMKRKKPPVLRLELTDEEREQFFRTFDDASLFMADLAKNRVVGSVRSSKRFKGERTFGGNLRPDSDAARAAFARFAWAKPLFVVAIETGLRKGDLLALQWRSVDVENGVIELMMAKTSRVVVVPISKACREALHVCRSRSSSDQVFTSEDGRPFPITRMHRTFDRAKRIAGITRRMRIHDFRHSFASRLASRNVNAILIRDSLGHSGIAATMRYTKVAANALNAVRDALDGA